MFPYIPTTKGDQQYMLDYLGIEHIERLFDDIPESIKLKRKLNINSSMSEIEVKRKIKHIANKNLSCDDYTCFLGAGVYDHFIPSVVQHVISRSEFYTAYTPYQPEISQGTLQAIFEYQTMIANLTDMDVSNASMYDGASAGAEAAMVAARVCKGNKIIMLTSVNPEVRAVVKTYMKYKDIDVVEADFDDVLSFIDNNTLCVIVQNPNFFGVIEDYTEIEKKIHKNSGLFIMCVDPISLSILKTPGEYGADIAVGEGQVLGNCLNFGGPYLGFMASTKKLMRKLPGRIVGQTEDADGKRAFVLTLQAREQHIRREKATSNICSNESLNALAAAVYMSTLGERGIKEVAVQTVKKSYYAYRKLINTGKFKPIYSEKPFFREFVLQSDIDVSKINKVLMEHKILGGYEIEKAYPDCKNQMLFCVTEKRTKEEIDYLAYVVEGIR